MKKVIIGSILIIGLAAGFAFAHGGWNGHMRGSGYGGHMMGPGYGNHMMGTGFGGHMMGPGYGGHMKGFNGGDNYNCPGAALFGPNGWDSEGHQKFLEDTVGIRKELNDKRFLYWENRHSPNTNQEQLAALEKEITDLQHQLQDKSRQY